MLNSVVLAGNLGGDPEVFYSQSGEPVANFNLAFRAGKKKTGWIRVTAFNKLAEITEKHLHKGARIAVSGSLDHHKWESECYRRNRTMPKSPVLEHASELNERTSA